MTTNYTPGPWEFHVYSGGCTIVSKHDVPGKQVRDSLKGVSVTVDAQIRDDQSNLHEASADARLIATAPDGHKLAEHVDAMANDAYLVGHPEWEEIVNEARALIAKVEGVKV